ncbi:16S rRNA (cytidine(1402)-2'-O)-methyltransferase [Mycoplasmopsis felis]|uniref:Ribosomal RNA small subunit methyltransferase I n=1 Tax=Mycoplasmopsis felis TaxID=33923 RepID=A0A809SF29_9BACT|nr:16S rRNA (cytidine(1402)-2'-O)-methyltransferase [Mycoplasmopsis felis]BBU47878.1 ribosomal RNA small subunit methyltransferase I [Mycoplasmopsis felis]
MSKLYIVGTPIGNLKDITLRALETLSTVNIIACEDTRVTYKLLDKYDIKNKKLITNNVQTEKKTSNIILKYLLEGQTVALVSDAGMPLISDPGFDILNLAKENNIDIEVIPGVSASTMAFTGSGFSNTFSFLGFMKDKTIQRKNELSSLTIGTYIYFVSPHKLINTLNDIYEVFGNNVKLCLAKELTKLYEKWYFGTPESIINELDSNSIKGEYTLVLNIPKIKHVKINKYEKNKRPK